MGEGSGNRGPAGLIDAASRPLSLMLSLPPALPPPLLLVTTGGGTGGPKRVLPLLPP